ncbi:MAG: hypothetical protein HZB15_01615 [Actinobacteria bacterium]|nr:hypothetical protein [Actinomycetota bacterium]
MGFAAGLGSFSGGQLEAFKAAATSVAPTVVSCDNFDGPDSPLAGRAVQSTATCGPLTWEVQSGGWSVASGVALTDGTPDSIATLPVGQVDASVVAVVSGVSGSGGGVVLDHDGIATYLAAVLAGDGPVHADLVLVAAGAPTVLATTAVTLGPATTVSLDRLGDAVEVRVDGVPVISLTLDPGIIAILGGGDRAGLYASTASIQFDNLRVTSPLTT